MKKQKKSSWCRKHSLYVVAFVGAFLVGAILYVVDPLGLNEGEKLMANSAYYDVDVGDVYGDTSPFWDVGEYDKYYYAVLHAYNYEIFDGYPDGSFQPYKSINRAEVAKVLMTSFTYSLYGGPGNNFGFWDLSVGEWYMSYLYSAYMNGVLTGYPDGSMKPGNTVNRAELLKMFFEAAAVPLPECTSDPYIDVHTSDWFCKYVKFSQDYGLYGADWGYFYPGDPMNRGDVAELFYAYDILYLGMQ